MFRVFKLLALSVVVMTAACGGDGKGESPPTPVSCGYSHCGVLDGHSYVVHEPVALATNAPMLVLLHGAQVGLERTESMWQARAFADRYGYRLVIPQGNGNVWNYRSDITFIAALIDTVERERGPSSAVFVAGWSNGSELSQMFACDYADRVTGVISLAGPLPRGRACNPSRPVGIALMAGGNDTLVPISGGGFGTMALAEATSVWREAMACSGGGQSIVDSTLMPGTRSTTTIAEGCRAPVQQTVMDSAAHAPDWNTSALHLYMQDFFLRAAGS